MENKEVPWAVQAGIDAINIRKRELRREKGITRDDPYTAKVEAENYNLRQLVREAYDLIPSGDGFHDIRIDGGIVELVSDAETSWRERAAELLGINEGA